VVDSPSEVEGEDAAAHGDPAPAPAPIIVEEVWGAASLLRRLATFEATPSETALEVRVNDATGALYRIRTKPDESAAGLPLNVESSLAVAREWVGSHPSPWVRTWEISDDFEPVDESSPKESQASRPLLRLRKTDPPVGAVPSAQPDGMARTRDSATVVVSPDDFREMLSAWALMTRVATIRSSPEHVLETETDRERERERERERRERGSIENTRNSYWSKMKTSVYKRRLHDSRHECITRVHTIARFERHTVITQSLVVDYSH
jgi:hypothetical protein